MGRPPEVDGLRRNQATFIKRERLRRALIKTKPGETIGLHSEEVEMLLKWIKELERACKDGNA